MPYFYDNHMYSVDPDLKDLQKTVECHSRSNFACVEVLRPSQQLRSCRAGKLPINTVPGQA